MATGTSLGKMEGKSCWRCFSLIKLPLSLWCTHFTEEESALTSPQVVLGQNFRAGIIFKCNFGYWELKKKKERKRKY